MLVKCQLGGVMYAESVLRMKRGYKLVTRASFKSQHYQTRMLRRRVYTREDKTKFEYAKILN